MTEDRPVVDDRYALLTRVGRGATGEVFKALDLTNRDIVAVKLVDLEDAEDDVADIQREITVLAQCASPFVTKYLASTLVPGTSKLAIVMEYMAGGSARHVVDESAAESENGGGLGEGEISFITRDVLRALAYLHDEGKIHREVKAANVLLTADAEARLADFGVSGQMTHTLGARRKTFTGTPFWMAPEVIQGGEGYDEKADIWSLGITCYELALGAAPHSDLHPMRVLFVIPKQDPPRLPEDGRFSADFRDFVAKCLQKDAKARPSAEELLDHPFVQLFDDKAIAMLKGRVDKHVALTESEANANDPAAALAQPKINRTKGTPSWDFGDDSLGRQFSQQQAAQQTERAQTHNAEVASDHGGSSIYQSMGGTIRMANPSDHTDDDTIDSIASMGTGTMGTVSSRGTHKARYKLDEVLDHAVVHAPLMRTLIGPALESLDPNDDPNAQAAVDDAIEALGKLEVALPGSLNQTVLSVMRTISTTKNETLRALKTRANGYFGGDADESATTSTGGRSVVANYLLHRWQADVNRA